MTQKALKPCKHPGCPELTRDASGCCEAHKSDSTEYERYRGSAKERGYDSQWKEFRIKYLKRNPLCVDCLKAKPVKYVTATEVHHIKKLRDYPELKYTESNLMALCHDCHSIRTHRGE